MKKETILNIIASLFIFLFIYAAVSKMADYQKFRVQLGQSPMLTAFAPLVAWLTPSIEVIIAIMLATQRWRLSALYASFSLMVMFSAYIIAITRFSEYVPCSCGGILEKMNWNQHLVFNMGFVALALIGILIHGDPLPHKTAS
ncbi:MAG: MauE/DoxX family redox-associated membrane protein [Flavitalea sp.]